LGVPALCCWFTGWAAAPTWTGASAAGHRRWPGRAAGEVAVDLPGHGSCPVAAGRDLVGAIIAAMVATIGATGEEQADVVGYSLGARLAWSLAATGRERRLVLDGLNPIDPIAGDDRRWAQRVSGGGEGQGVASDVTFVAGPL